MNRFVLRCAGRLGAVVVSATTLSTATLAQPPAVAPASADAANEDWQGEESEQLRALREAELHLFPTTVPLSAPPHGVTHDVPSGLSSQIEATAPAVPEPEAPWLRGLRLPDLPLRWHPSVVRYLDHFHHNRRGQNLMRGWLRRSSRYGTMIGEELRNQGLPEDLRCVAMAESGFDPTVRSNRGAVGMWQFVSRTGAEYGLDQDRWVDQRMDPVASTRAAARYLGDLHRRLGSWELALAAYNMGYGALIRAIRKYNTNDYWVLASLEAGLPFETTIYVSKILACSVVMRNTEAFGFGDLTQDAPLITEDFELGGGVSLSRVARSAGVDPELLSSLNPHLRRGRTPPGRGTVTVHIPAGQSDAFARAWTRVRPRDPVHRTHTLRFGESLRQVAHRYRTNTRSLRELNGIEGDEHLLPGVALLVPAVAPREDAAPEEPPVVAVPDVRFDYPERRRVFFRPQRSDTLQDIASFFAVSVEDLRRWNHLDAHARLQSGMFLQLYVPRDQDLAQAIVLEEGDVRLAAVGSEAFFDDHERRQGRVRFRYSVVEGDTLSGIGRRFGISVGSLARINQMGRRTDLQIGQQIIVYADEAHVPERFRTPGQSVSAPEDAPSTETESSPVPATGAEDASNQQPSEVAPASPTEPGETSPASVAIPDEASGNNNAAESPEATPNAEPGASEAEEAEPASPAGERVESSTAGSPEDSEPTETSPEPADLPTPEEAAPEPAESPTSEEGAPEPAEPTNAADAESERPAERPEAPAADEARPDLESHLQGQQTQPVQD